MAETKKERLLRYLNDAYATQMGAIASMEDMPSVSRSGEFLSAVQSHMGLAKAHADELAARLGALGGTKSEAKSVVNQLGAKIGYFANIFHDSVDKDMQNATRLYALEELEVAMYTALQAYAQAAGDEETARLAERHRLEEEQAARQMLSLLPKLAEAAIVFTSA